MASYESIVAAKRTLRESLIPKAWILPREVHEQYAAQPITIFQQPIHPAVSPGILSSRELELTNTYHDATSTLERLHSGNASSEEVTIAFCKRAAIAHQLTNCLTEILFEQAIATARERDEEYRANSKLRPLHGLPMTFKDSFRIKGVDSSIGITALCNQPATSNSQCVDIALNNGAIIISKTTVPQTMLTADTDSVVFGRTCNAYKNTFGAGGSTGGEGALIAMGGSPLGIGTDGAGSVRMPAFVNGIIGYKPSGYRYPLDGVPIMGSGVMGSTAIGPVSVAGPLTRSVRDAQLFTKIVSQARPWEKDPFLLPNPWLDLDARINPSQRFRIGIWLNPDHVHPMPPVDYALKICDIRLGYWGHKLFTFDGPSLADVWDLQKQWAEVQDLRYLRKLISSEPTTTIVEKTKIIHPSKPAPELTLDRLHELNRRIAELVVSMTRAWNACGDSDGTGQPIDALLLVPAPHPAMPFDEYTDLTFTALMNIIDWPAITLPFNDVVSPDTVQQENYIPENAYPSQHFGKEDERIAKIWKERREEFVGLPLSLQLIGRRGEDEKLLTVARIVHAHINEASQAEKDEHARSIVLQSNAHRDASLAS